MTTTQSPRIKNPKLAKPTAAQIDPFARALPVAEPKQVWAHTKWVLRRHKGQLSLVLILHSFAAVAALALPFLIGRLIDDLRAGAQISEVDRFVLFLLAAVIAAAPALLGLKRAGSRALLAAMLLALALQGARMWPYTPLHPVQVERMAAPDCPAPGGRGCCSACR